MKVPRKFNVLGKEYKIKKIKNLTDDDGSLLYGRCHRLEPLIEYDSGQTKEELQNTLIHELIHAVCHESGLSLMMGNRIEELVCINLSNALMKNGYRLKF